MRKFFPIAAVAALLAASPANAGPVEDFYKNKTITVAVGAGSTGSYAIYSRLLVDHVGQYIPGKPNLIFKSMPGAGGLRATNYAYNAAPKDGSFILLIVQTAAVDQLLKAKKAKFDVRKFQFLGRYNDNTPISVGWIPAGVTSLDVLRKRSVPTSATGLASPTNILPSILRTYAGLNYKVISGYKGAGAMKLAMEQGETQAMVASLTTFQSSLASYIRDNKVKILAQLAPNRHKDIPDVPTAAELATSDEGKKVANFFASSADIGRAFVVPPGVPADRVKALRAAFERTLTDPKFLVAAKKLNVGLNPASPGEMEKIVAETLKTPKEIVKAAAKMYSRK
jgi:tripartite-type tricarboxylate transporter receptor subunit TctC